jgi:hypothetical protein
LATKRKTVSGSARATIDHDEIRNWVEEHGGEPAMVKRTRSARGTADSGILRIDFPGYSGEQSLEAIGWDEFFERFENAKLAFLYQDVTGRGGPSRFNKLVKRDSVDVRAAPEGDGEAAGTGRAGARKKTGASKKTGARKKTGASKKTGARKKTRGTGAVAKRRISVSLSSGRGTAAGSRAAARTARKKKSTRAAAGGRSTTRTKSPARGAARKTAKQRGSR